MSKFEYVKAFYQMGLYSKDDVQLFVQSKDITQEQANEILASTTTAA